MVSAVSSLAQLRDALESASSPLVLALPAGARWDLQGVQLTIAMGVDATLLCEDEEGATLDAGGLSRAVAVSNGGRLTLQRVHLSGGVATNGGCALVNGTGAVLMLREAHLFECRATGALVTTAAATEFGLGGAIFVGGGAVATVFGSSISDAVATGKIVSQDGSTTGGEGGAIHVAVNGALHLAHSRIVRAAAIASESLVEGAFQAVASGGGVAVRGSAHVNMTTFENVSAQANFRAFGGAVFMAGVRLDLSGCTLVRAAAVTLMTMQGGMRVGGGVSVAAGDVLISSTTFDRSTVSGARWATAAGAAVAVMGATARAVVRSSTIRRSSALGNWGRGAIWAMAGTLELDDCTLHDAVTGGFSWAYGAALSLQGSPIVRVSNSTFDGARSSANRGTYGGAIGMHTFAGTLIIADSLIIRASASSPSPRQRPPLEEGGGPYAAATRPTPPGRSCSLHLPPARLPAGTSQSTAAASSSTATTPSWSSSTRASSARVSRGPRPKEAASRSGAAG